MNVAKKILDTKDRFSFGKNWSRFLKNLNQERIEEAEKSLKEKLNLESLEGKIFLDIGSGSGLFSLAAYRLGAKVFSFDYDQDSVNCTKYLKEKYANNDSRWTVEQGSVLDKEFLKKFGKVDVLYSWGVLHHTGHMHVAFENVADMVANDGYLFISIYNDQGGASKRWKWIKKTYNNTNIFIRYFIIFYTFIKQWWKDLLSDFLKGHPFQSMKNYKKNRGMSPYYDLIDWVGGYPFEVAKPEEVFNFFKSKNFDLQILKTCAGGLGCNEYVFKMGQTPKVAPSPNGTPVAVGG